jgi:hypothetical protein
VRSAGRFRHHLAMESPLIEPEAQAIADGSGLSSFLAKLCPGCFELGLESRARVDEVLSSSEVHVP